jgi:hypothetical protein
VVYLFIYFYSFFLILFCARWINSGCLPSMYMYTSSSVLQLMSVSYRPCLSLSCQYAEICQFNTFFYLLVSCCVLFLCFYLSFSCSVYVQCSFLIFSFLMTVSEEVHSLCWVLFFPRTSSRISSQCFMLCFHCVLMSVSLSSVSSCSGWKRLGRLILRNL